MLYEKSSESDKKATYSINKMSAEDMWNCIKSDNQSWGIPGYEIPKQYFDHKQAKWVKDRERIRNEHRAPWPPNDWPKAKEGDTKVPPKRPNFIEDTIIAGTKQVQKFPIIEPLEVAFSEDSATDSGVIGIGNIIFQNTFLFYIILHTFN